ncbi:MAG: hypothetical protein JRI23_31420 [Deltaproteobacteria bacterium]|nr:hypothetical protein [Deltaproteobacteria bacterium]MBW2536720.1 hypothetical protein [Deltaproteobacteria bacterium]
MTQAIAMPSESPSRSERYRQLILQAPYEICIERARYVTAAYRQSEGEHPSLRAARAFQHTVRNMTLRILDCEGIIGNQTSKLVSAALPVERGDINRLLELELDNLLRRETQPYHIAPADRVELEKEILPYWTGKTVRDRRKLALEREGLRVSLGLSPQSLLTRWRSLNLRPFVEMARTPSLSPLRSLEELREISYDCPGAVMNSFDVQGHLVLGDKNVIAHGFAGLRAQADGRARRCQAEGDEEGAAFCQGVIICCDAMRELGDRYGALAREHARREPSPPRRAELEAIAERCEHSPYQPPRSFREAVQALWLTQVGAIVAYGMTGIFAVGRPDQYLWPLYEQDRASGALSREAATELIAELLVKLSTNLLILPTVGKSTGSELAADSQGVTVGGVDRSGADGTNELSFLFLDAVQQVKGLGNTFTIRVSERSPDGWLRKIAETYRATSGPAVFSDEKVIEALEHCGCSTEDARDYAVIGCVEPTPDGNTFGCTSGNDISLVGALEMTLLSGRLRLVGKRVGPDTGDPRRFATFDQLLDAYRRQVRFLVEAVAQAVRIKDQTYAAGFHNPYVSMTLDGCIDRARDMTCGGARYNFSSISARGLGTAVDSLAAIQTAIFTEQRYTMEELLAALAANFRGHEIMRQVLRNRMPKYGCDDPRADAIAARLVDGFCREVERQVCFRGGRFRPGFFSYGMHVLEGSLLGATPDGRRAGEPISNSLSPSNGSERAGPTGVLNSVAKLGHGRISNGSALNMRLLPSLLATEERRDKLCGLLRGYFASGGMEVQLNVVDDATLRDAQRHPERYRDLTVRVSGYSAFFTDLGRAIQDEIISRTAFGSFGPTR